MLLKKVPPALVAAESHSFDLNGFESVHRNASYEGDVHSKTAVDTRAGQANEDAKFRGRPLR